MNRHFKTCASAFALCLCLSQVAFGSASFCDKDNEKDGSAPKRPFHSQQKVAEPDPKKAKILEISPNIPQQQPSLSLEIKVHILSFLTQYDLLRAGGVSRNWRQAAQHIWASKEIELPPKALTEQDFITLARGIFPHIDLEEMHMPVNIEAFVRAFSNTVHIITLNLTLNNINDEQTIVITESLKKNRSLTGLCLKNNNIKTQGAKAIAENLPSLLQLDLYENAIGNGGVHFIALHQTNLVKLNLYDNRITPGGINPLRCMINLAHLNLSHNRMNESDYHVLECLTNLQHLTLNNCEIVDSDLETLTKGSPRLLKLKLETNHIGKNGALAIAKRFPSLISLSLYSNNIDDSDVEILVKGLPNLRKLDLSFNYIGDTGIQAIVTHQPSLEVLKMEVNKSSNNGIHTLVEGLPNLKKLFVADHTFGKEGEKVLEELKQRKPFMVINY